MKQFEIILLGLLIFVLPSLETPKTIFWALYILTFLFRRYREHGFTFDKPDFITLTVITLFLVSLISTFASWPIQAGLRGAFDTLRYTALFLCIYHAAYTHRQLKSIAVVIVLGSITGLAFALIEFSSGVSSSLSFHSAGVTTQSSIYLGIAIITNFGLLIDNSKKSRLFTLFLYSSLILMGVAELYMGSRGAIVAIILCLAIVLILNHSRQVLILTSSLIISISIAAFLLINAYPTNMNKSDKNERFSVERFKKSDNERLESWRIAIKHLSTGKDVVWGIGPKEFSTIDPHDLGIESSFYQRAGKINHAHNLFLTQWVEQGLIGLVTLLAFFSLIAIRLKKSRAHCKEKQQQWAWVAGLGGLVIPIIAGSFNTPFYQEHAMLAMILMGAMYVETNKSL